MKSKRIRVLVKKHTYGQRIACSGDQRIILREQIVGINDSKPLKSRVVIMIPLELTEAESFVRLEIKE